MAASLGADITINSAKEDAFKAAMDFTNGKGADVVYQVSSYVDPTVEEYMNLATEIVRPRGILAFQGDFLHPVTIDNIHRWHHQALDIRSLAFRHYPLEEIRIWAEDTLKPVMYGMIKIKPLLTGPYKLSKVVEAFKEANENPNALKVVIKP